MVIDEPYEGMPAAEVGLKKGDIVLSIDDSLMTDKDVSYVSNRLRGDAGTMANVLGYNQQPFYIWDKYLGTDAISLNMKKKDMLFPEHVDELHTQETDLWYFGDKKDYVGWGISGNYYLNGANVWADQDYNWYIPKADYHD